jgi:hypothetical protein
MRPAKAPSLHLRADGGIRGLIRKILGARRRAAAANERDHGEETGDHSQPHLHPQLLARKSGDYATNLAKFKRYDASAV